MGSGKDTNVAKINKVVERRYMLYATRCNACDVGVISKKPMLLIWGVG